MPAFDRRRLAVATVFTVVALPSLWLLESGRTRRGTTVATAAAGVAPPVATADQAGSTSSVYRPELPSFLDGPTPAPAPAVVNIAVPATPTANETKVLASFRRFDDGSSRPCTTLLAPSGTRITLTNVDNGLVTTCRNQFGVNLPHGVQIVLDTDVFTEIADLVDAPVSVRLSW